MKNINVSDIFFTTLGVMLVSIFMIGMTSCKKENLSDGLGGFDPDGDIAILALGLMDRGMENDVQFMDVAGGLVYSLAEASTNPQNIDFVMMHDAQTGFSIITPQDIRRLSRSEAGRVMNNTWLNKNKSTLVKKAASEAALALFKEISNSGEIRQAYDAAIAEVSGDNAVYGPGISLTGIEKNDLIFFHSEDRNFYAVLKVFKVIPDEGLIEFEIKMDNNSLREVAPGDSSNLMTMYDATFQSPGQTAGVRYLDFSTGNAFNNTDVLVNQHTVDFVCFNSSINGTNFIVPAAEVILNGFGGGRTMNSDWLVKNDGVLMKLDASPEADSIFLFTINNEMIRNAFNTVAQTIGSMPGYEEDVQGPGPSVKSVSEGDLIFFKSVSRNIYGMARVAAHEAGNAGKVTLSAKVDNGAKTNVPAAPNRMFDVSSTGYASAKFFDFLAGRVYSEAEAKPLSANIDLIYTLGSSTRANIFPTSNETALKAWSSSIWPARIAEWEVRNDVSLVNLGNDPIYETLREGRLADMKQAFEDAGPALIRLTRLAKNDVVLFHSEDRGFYGAIKILAQTDEDGNLQFKYKVAKE